MRLFFSLLSALYIFLIFYLGDSAVVNRISNFNPYSLLHIPLYGILSTFIFLSLQDQRKPKGKRSYLLTALIAGAVGIMDETYQSLLPQREASAGDVLLDLGGIFLALFIIKHTYPWWLNAFLGKKISGGKPFSE